MRTDVYVDVSTYFRFRVPHTYNGNGNLPIRGSSTLMMEATGSLYQTTRRHMPGDSSLEICSVPALPESRIGHVFSQSCMLFCSRDSKLPSVLRRQDISLYSPRWDLILSPTYHHCLHASPQISSFFFIERNRKPDVSNSLPQVGVKTMEMGSKGPFCCFARAAFSLYRASKMGVAMCQSTVEVIMLGRSARPHSLNALLLQLIDAISHQV